MRAIDEWSSEGLKALEVIRVDMRQEASERWSPAENRPEIVDPYLREL